MVSEQQVPNIDYKKYGFKVAEKYKWVAPKGLNEKIVRKISEINEEPEWMLNIRLKALKKFLEMPMPEWGADLSKINFDEIRYYIKPTDKKAADWKDLPEEIKETFERLGLPEAEKKFLAGVGTQYESEVVLKKIRKDLAEKGVIFTDMNTAVREHSELVKKYFGKLVPYSDNKFAALNTAVWSGGTFIYVPKGVKVQLPLQTYFRINAMNVGQFERTLIIVEEGGEVHYIEGCSAPIYSASSLHAAVVEIFAKKNSKVRYTTIQNWSKNVYNLVTKRAIAEENAFVTWVDGNIGSRTTMKYPAIILSGKGAKGEVLSIAFATKDQVIDAGAKIIHLAEDTQSRIISKSISKEGGISSYRGLVKIAKEAKNAKSNVMCDALILDEKSVSNTYPYVDVQTKHAFVSHEAKVGKVSEDQIFYLMSRGLKEGEALSMIVLGFISDIMKEIPLEYALELNKLIQLEMEGSVG